MNEGVAIHELIYDDNLPVDYKIIDVNPAFEKILGINKEEVLERKASKLYNTKKAPYLDIYSKVVETGNPEYFETYFEPFDQHFRISVFSPSEEAFVTVFEDITLRKRSELKLKESEEQINAIFNTVNSGIILIDTEGFIRIANQHMTKMFGFNHSQFIGMSYLDLINNKERTASETDMGKLINGEVDNLFIERQYKRKDSSVFWGNLSGTRILNEDGSLKGLIGVITNITDLKKSNDALKNSLKEKDALLMEVHHRVKNNMQIISSLLNLQINHEDSDEIIKVLKESQGRVKSMAMIHEKLYQSPSFNNISFKNYVERLVFDIFYSYGIKTDSIESVLDIEDINLNIETAIPLGLIINELVTNSVKHAFSKGEGTIIIKLKSSPNHMQLIVADDGIGIPKNIDIGKTETLGLKLVNSLADQLDGELHLDSSHGTEFKLIFKELEYKERI
nr:PAS domain S-box protein [uncultured Methanobacterium sp.]